MAWRIDESVIRGEIDSRMKGKVTGRIWLVGRDEPVIIELKGNPWRDLAGHLLRFTNPEPKERNLDGLGDVQRGVTGDITASRKVKVPECSMDELKEHFKAKTPFPWHWGNSLYLEWFSERNGRVVVESAHYKLDLETPATWQMSEEEEIAQRKENGNALTGFMELLTGTVADAASEPDPAEFEDEPPQSAAEAEADAEAARMDLLMDRIQARMEREGNVAENFERIMDEERERLRRERGEPEPEPLTPEEEEERAAWIEEMNAAAEQALEEDEGDSWKDVEDRHPLVERTSDLGVRLHHEVDAGGWVRDAVSGEHPIYEIVHGVMSASAKMAGAFGMSLRGEWPPDSLIAGNVLVRLKKARGYLRDAISGLDAADAANLATPDWRSTTRREVDGILAEVKECIAEVRATLE